MPLRREPVSIVTVFNDLETRRDCLDRSIEAHRAEAPEVEYLPVDNASGVFATAGAALNHGAAQARHDYVAFVHQDVYLHSLGALEQAAGMLADDDGIGVIGAVGPTPAARFRGRVRDRVFLLGDSAPRPTPVDCVDELLFMVPRRTLEQEPLAEDPALAWHAYAVEYGLRARARGKRVCVADIPLTHNSLTENLDQLDVAYSALAAKHPAAMPLMTPQGRVGERKPARRRLRFLEAHRWRYRWLRESLDAHRGRRAAGGDPGVLGDIRIDVDELLERLPAHHPLLVVNVDRQGEFADGDPGPLELTRNGRPVLVTSRRRDGVAALVTTTTVGSSGRTPILITNLTLDDVRALAPAIPSPRRVLGFRGAVGYWMVLNVPPALLPPSWCSVRARPLGMPAATSRR